jgi:hypothetical protein
LPGADPELAPRGRFLAPSAPNGPLSRNALERPGSASTATSAAPPSTVAHYRITAKIGFTAHYFFVIDNSETELEVVCTDSGVVFSGVARRQF